ncbi:hypothetical protein [Klebsiella pneumoniae]|jgi:hypothetical protein|uniref:hypothetical protein n=2 Tax=Klebsiella pneumoniae TaxID=573 RepID=UPI0009378182|nr:hypothetical protein [Klebsiella pneumoniae]MDK6282273.1 hypothetical protein [Klebsiella pneumoniae]MDM3476054.1 hypothetical protein [Klebsiella pneumoniae]RNP16046.1 hypothetical protein BL151_00003970 [Klebsiella pneumoniae]RRF85500.1 hypothetical protein EAO22_24255 [Klebsiella pneumoniae]TXW95769.1 hypothetical protein D4M61_27635 [Klebsiella pneumoniae]
MTITLQAVNELIASLESAGELSIREQKFLKLAKEFRICSASLDAAIKTGNVLADQNAQLAAENVALKQIVDSVTDLSNEPQYHSEGMGCGLEDRGITDRYDACRYGWDEAMERVYGEVIPNTEELEFPATDAVLAELRNEAGARAVELFAKTLGSPYSFRDEKCYEDGFTRAIEIVRDAQAPRFAKQLREGADK